MKATTWVVHRRSWQPDEYLAVVATGTYDECQLLASRLNASRDLDENGQHADIYEINTQDMYEWESGPRTHAPKLTYDELEELERVLRASHPYAELRGLVIKLDPWQCGARTQAPKLNHAELEELERVLRASSRHEELRGLVIKLEVMRAKLEPIQP